MDRSFRAFAELVSDEDSAVEIDPEFVVLRQRRMARPNSIVVTQPQPLPPQERYAVGM
jgi:hypothetical protein